MIAAPQREGYRTQGRIAVQRAPALKKFGRKNEVSLVFSRYVRNLTEETVLRIRSILNLI